MANISFTPVADGATATAASVNTPLSTIVNDYNGNITDANISASAAIAGSKINLASIANPYKFSVYLAGAQNSTNGFSKVLLDTKTFDTGTNCDVVTNHRFTAPVAGFYYFNFTVGMGAAAQVLWQAMLYKNGSLVKSGSVSDVSAAYQYSTGSGLLQLSATDYVELYIYSAGIVALAAGAVNTSLDGFFVSAT